MNTATLTKPSSPRAEARRSNRLRKRLDHVTHKIVWLPIISQSKAGVKYRYFFRMKQTV
jgi:hypothetical protein